MIRKSPTPVTLDYPGECCDRFFVRVTRRVRRGPRVEQFFQIGAGAVRINTFPEQSFEELVTFR